MSQLVWLRNDLRMADNPALYHAAQTQEPLRVVYFATPLQWQSHAESSAQLGLREGLLNDLRERLAQRGVVLEVLECPWYDDVPERLLAYCQQHQVRALWMNDQCWWNEKRRDEAVVQTLERHGIACQVLPDELLVNQPLMTGSGKPYRVFTPWYRQWIKVLFHERAPLLPEPFCGTDGMPLSTSLITLPTAGRFRKDLWPASERDAQQSLTRFCEQRAPDYALKRDYPACNGTSVLSPYLAVGALSVRQCLFALQTACQAQSHEWLDHVWLKELAWREFYRYLMRHFPGLGRAQAFYPEKEPQWLESPEWVLAWQNGATGFPLVDAAMVQLQRTGWMHNRLRMLTGSFFAKLMLNDWRVGERFFMQHLIDGDFSSNNGGWQWCSSVGCDAAPWFRIFNPTRQSQKFDPEGQFIKKMLPELSSLSAKDIHCPSAAQRRQLGYPEAIFDYSAARKRALEWR